MDMGGSNLVLQAAIERDRHSEPNLVEVLNDTGHPGRQAAARNLAAVTGLIVTFLGILLAIGAMTQSPDDPTTAGQPAPVAAPTAVVEFHDHAPLYFLADSSEPAG